jgi:serine/threonine protein kinase
MWSLGCIAYALLSGSLPFDCEAQEETIKMTLHGPLEFDLPIWDQVSSSAKDLITGLLQKDPNKRLTLEKAMAHPWLKSMSQ